MAEDDVPQIIHAVHNGRQLDGRCLRPRRSKEARNRNRLEAFDSQINTTTGTLRLRAIFNNDDESLFPNQFVNVRLLVDTHKGVTLLPNSAIQRNDNGAFVYLLQPNQTVAREADHGRSDRRQCVRSARSATRRSCRGGQFQSVKRWREGIRPLHWWRGAIWRA